MRILTGIVQNKYVDKLAAWISVSHVEKAPKKKAPTPQMWSLTNMIEMKKLERIILIMTIGMLVLANAAPSFPQRRKTVKKQTPAAIPKADITGPQFQWRNWSRYSRIYCIEHTRTIYCCASILFDEPTGRDLFTNNFHGL